MGTKASTSQNVSLVVFIVSLGLRCLLVLVSTTSLRNITLHIENYTKNLSTVLKQKINDPPNYPLTLSHLWKVVTPHLVTSRLSVHTSLRFTTVSTPSVLVSWIFWGGKPFTHHAKNKLNILIFVVVDLYKSNVTALHQFLRNQTSSLGFLKSVEWKWLWGFKGPFIFVAGSFNFQRMSFSVKRTKSKASDKI